MSPRVSVLIPTWNREKYLGEAIESVLVQTHRRAADGGDGEAV